MNAAILSVGDELVLGTTLDTNSQLVARALRDVGFAAVEHRTVGDSLRDIVDAMAQLSQRAELLIVTGGLGPTDDDLTRDALNTLVDGGAAMVEDHEWLAALRALFEGRGRTMPAINVRQAMRPQSACTLPNANGTAPGLSATHGRARIFCLPGPPSEMRPMLETFVLPELRQRGAPPVIRSAVHCFGVGESRVAELLGDRMRRGRDPSVGTTASQSIVTVQVVTQGGDGEARAASEADDCAALLQPYVFGRDDQSLAGALLAQCASSGATIAVAESCTAGMAGAAIASVPGSSAHFLGGWIAYSNSLKVSELGVPDATIQRHGAVSAECAWAMAEGAAARAHASLGIAITGIAGPGGDTRDKPVGTVFVAIHLANPAQTSVRRFQFPGPRDTIRDRATKSALQMARWQLLGVSAPLIWERT